MKSSGRNQSLRCHILQMSAHSNSVKFAVSSNDAHEVFKLFNEDSGQRSSMRKSRYVNETMCVKTTFLFCKATRNAICRGQMVRNLEGFLRDNRSSVANPVEFPEVRGREEQELTRHFDGFTLTGLPH